MDRIETLMHRGEILNHISTIENVLYMFKESDIPDNHPHVVEMVDNLRSFKGLIAKIDHEILPFRVNRSDAVDWLVKAYQDGTMRGIMGYRNRIMADGRLQAEKLRNAAISLGGAVSGWQEFDSGSVHFNVQFTGSVIEELEGLAFPE
jgi:hypothetical protein